MLWLVAGLLLGLSLGFHAGWYGKQVMGLLRDIRDRDPEPAPRVASPLPPEYAALNNTSSAFVNPKPPEVMRFEENERIRRVTGQ